MNKFTGPMLAADSGIRFPCLLSPKIDGWRAVNRHGKMLSRTFKDIPNIATREFFSGPELHGLDGELVVGSCCDPQTFRRTQSGISTIKFDPQAVWYVFDYVDDDWLDKPFCERYTKAKAIVKKWRPKGYGIRLQIVPQIKVSSQAELDDFEEKMLEQGFEGAMGRDAESPYKCGRVESEGWLVKFKRYKTDEATVTGFEELMHNDNLAIRNAVGKLQRGTSKAGMRPGGTLGKLVCSWKGHVIRIGGGPGFTQALRDEIWRNRKKYLGAPVTFKYLPKGMKDKPRSGQWVGFRSLEDMS